MALAAIGAAGPDLPAGEAVLVLVLLGALLHVHLDVFLGILPIDAEVLEELLGQGEAVLVLSFHLFVRFYFQDTVITITMNNISAC